MNTGEDTQGLRKIIDLTRLISLVILSIHFYIICYQAFREWHWTAVFTDRIIGNVAKTGFFNDPLRPKLAALLFLCISLLGAKGKKDEGIQRNSIGAYLICGLLIYFLSLLIFYLPAGNSVVAIGYMGITGAGYLLILTGGTWLSRLIKANLTKDIFNKDNETFPQEERLLENEYSINLPAKYNLNGKVRDSYINIINPHRSTAVLGLAGAGKWIFRGS
ncbi:YWFCY domain-containing protein [Mucilaginibacter sp. FT3.2]|uniref:YWFCY domain-containing protein n=1 Tax=Mucilaginibacter sp. FT3.2 TaxID=2723090 RepID=UPI00160793EE|nr:YWFCY domain-containing protein [Mucilaginibacter sp. FT3.2]MBB6235332.1 hypothetical protein [Mucilaginibacter sp. FT3.2]